MISDKPYCYHVKYTWLAISRMYQTFADYNHATLTQAYVLLTLDDKVGKASTQIAPLIGMEARSLTRVLRAMEDEFLIRKEHGKEDKRQVNILLTPEGVKAKKKAKSIIRSFSEEVEEKVGTENLITFLKVLDTINHLAEQNHYHPNE